MDHNEWWRGALIYHVYLPSFSDSNGDGIGDLNGLCRRIDYIAALGMEAIWISPFYVSPMEDWGYDIADYRAVDPRFGTIADFDAVVDRIHRAGMRVIIDQVWSHTAAAHPWFQESQSSRDNPKNDWYVWADPGPDGLPPNNWLSVFGGSAWQWAPARRQYYLHHFLTGQPKLNLHNDAVVDAHFVNAEFWLARGVDGFRLDAIDFMLHDESLRNNPPRSPPAADIPWNPFRMQRHVHDMCNPASVRLMQQIRTFMDRHPGTTTIGEISSEAGALARITTLTGATKLHMAYTLGAMKTAFSAASLRQILRDTITLHRTGWLCWAFSNHDVERVATRWNPSGRHAAAFARLELALLLTLPGSVSLYQGEELSLPEARIPPAAIRDPFGLHFYPAFSGRDGARAPMPWTGAAPQAGFSTARETWLPVDPRYAELAVDQQERDPDSALAVARRLIAWRKQHPALTRGEVDIIDLPDPILAFRRHLGNEAIVAAFNLSDQSASLDAACLPFFEPDEAVPFVTRWAGDALHLPPFGFSLGRARP
jgi:alpha-glucosidase